MMAEMDKEKWEERRERRLDWIERHPEQAVKPSMKRRKEGHDYTQRCVYLFTLCIEGRRALFGTLRDTDREHEFPWVEPSALGLRVIAEWSEIAVEQPLIESVAFQLMPDHVHGILFVKAPLPRHVGHYVSRFKAKCTVAMRNMSVYSETQSRTLSLWEPGYNDRILSGKGQLRDWVNYLRDNPRRLWVKRHHPEWFTARHDITVGTTPVAVMGNQFLLEHPHKVVVRELAEQLQHILLIA